jgi:hypothetical protein
MKTLNVGIEIETVGLDKLHLANAIQRVVGGYVTGDSGRERTTVHLADGGSAEADVQPRTSHRTPNVITSAGWRAQRKERDRAHTNQGRGANLPGNAKQIVQQMKGGARSTRATSRSASTWTGARGTALLTMGHDLKIVGNGEDDRCARSCRKWSAWGSPRSSNDGPRMDRSLLD